MKALVAVKIHFVHIQILHNIPHTRSVNNPETLLKKVKLPNSDERGKELFANPVDWIRLVL
jgi:hypothetical protein